jgi:heme exporter protein CcmD
MNLSLYWPDLAMFAHMGGYGGYVWGALVVTLGALALEVASLRAERRLALRAARRARRAP